MVLREEHFSSILVLVNDMLTELEAEQKDSRHLKLFRGELMEGKRSERSKPGYCSFLVKKDKQRLLEPALRGPFKVLGAVNAEQETFKQVIQVASMPFALIRISNKAIDLSVSFESPTISFRRDANAVDSESDIQLARISALGLTEAP